MARDNPAPDVVDMIFGGHDHAYHRELLNNVFIQKSGSDFEEFTNLIVLFGVKEKDYKTYLQRINAE